MTDLLTVEDLTPLILDLAARYPEVQNPTSPTGIRCLWTTPPGVEHPTGHSFIGTLAAEQGWDVPGPGDTYGALLIAQTLNWPITSDAMDLLQVVQWHADQGTPPWGQVPSLADLPGAVS